MSNPYRYAFPPIRHYQMPRAMDQWLNSMSRDEFRLLHLVQSEGERTSRTEVTLSTPTICKRTGIHRTNIGKARQGLIDYGLLLADKEARQYTYAICDPQTKAIVPDRNSLERIDFNTVSASVLTAYIKAILVEIKATPIGVAGHCPLPTHPDTTASFTMDVDHGGNWWCRGCGKKGSLMDLEMYLSEDAVGATIDRSAAHKVVMDKLRALGLGRPAMGKLRKSADIVYSYTDEFGEVLTETVRRGGDKSKTVRRQPHPTNPGKYIYNTKGCRNVLYRLHEVDEASTVIVVEGEKDVETLRKLGLKDDIGDLVAVTTNCGGAGQWLADHSTTLKHKRVILIGDTDERGVEHMLQVKASLEAVEVRELIHVELPTPYKDVSDFLVCNRTQKLIDLVGDDWLEAVEALGEVTDI